MAFKERFLKLYREFLVVYAIKILFNTKNGIYVFNYFL